MPTGRVKVFDEERNFGFVQPLEGGADLFVHLSAVEEEQLRAGDLVEFEVEEGDQGLIAIDVRVTERAPEDNPSGRVVVGAPPVWDELEDVSRRRRDNRKRRRRR